MPYRKIDPKLWDDEKIARLDVTTKLVWIYVLTGTHTTSLPGLWIVGPASMAEGLRLPVDTVIVCLKTLRSLGVIDWDERARLLRVRNAPRHNKADNHRVVNAWFSKWRDLPECRLKYDHIESLRDGVVGTKADEVWAVTFGEVVTPEQFESSSESLANDSRIVPNCSPVLSDLDHDLTDLISGSLSSAGSSDARAPIALPVPEQVTLHATNLESAQQPLLAIEPSRAVKPQRKRAERQSVAPSLQGYAQAYADGQVDAGAETFARDLSSRAEVAYRRILTDHAGSPRGDEAKAVLRRFSADYRRAIPGSKVQYQNGFAPWRCLEWLNSRGANVASTLQPGHGGNVGTYVNLDDYAEAAQ